MPLTKEGQRLVAQNQRQDDTSYRFTHGENAWQEKLAREGVYTYRFETEDLLDNAIDIADDHNASWCGHLPPDQHVLIIEKPFDRLSFEQRLTNSSIPFEIVPVYRLAELADEEILQALSGGIIWLSYCYIDVEHTIQR